MAFIGNVEFVEGRPASKTTTLVLKRCLHCGKDDGKVINEFLETLNIVPDAFFRDIDGDWDGRPFIGGHVFNIVQKAGYEGTEHDLWESVTGNLAPYPVKNAKKPAPKKTKIQLESKKISTDKAKVKAARSAAIKEAWAARN